jgi:hypothetical protein
VNSVKAMRGCLVLDPAGKLLPFARAVFEAYWRDDQDISRPDVLTAICHQIEIDPEPFFHRHRSAGNQGQTARQYTGTHRSRRVRLTHHLRRRRRHVFRQRSVAAGACRAATSTGSGLIAPLTAAPPAGTARPSVHTHRPTRSASRRPASTPPRSSRHRYKTRSPPSHRQHCPPVQPRAPCHAAPA